MDVVWTAFLFAIGACVGSFVNVVVWRLPRGESIVFPPSHCPACGEAIRWYDNIPIVSWLLLRARCRSCGGRISPRYLLIEALTGTLVAGLYVCYFVLDLRDGAGDFAAEWPMFAAHAALLCGLLAASAVDVEQFIVPLPVMWFCALVGIAAAAFRPHPFMPAVHPAAAAGAAGGVVGLIIAQVLLARGWIQPSFLDAEDRPTDDDRATDASDGVAITAAHGVNPRKEILHEVVYLAPAIALAGLAALAATHVAPLRDLLGRWLGGEADPTGGRLASGMGAVFGMVIGAAWIWGTRILGTLGFGKEAMGMGDVHILAAVGAVLGWKAVSLAFFAAPMFGLLWALYLLAAKGRRELPYGPWLAAGTLAVMLFYDAIVGFIHPPGA